jgi:hypothetical protein
MENDLKSAMEKLETCLVTPIVSGEMETWTESVRESFDAVLEPLKEWLVSTGKKQLKSMAQQDSELLPRVDQLRQQGDELLVEAEEFRKMIARAAVKSEQVEPNEGLAVKDVSETMKRGLAFVLQYRTYSVALDTWFNEAFNRDRGVAD